MSLSKISLNIVILAMIFLWTTTNGQFANLPERIKEAKRSSLSIEYKRINQDINKIKPVLLGSAFMVKKDGKAYAVTNSHVIAGIKKDQHQILVGANLKQGKSYLQAEVIKNEPTVDVAILSLGEPLFYSGNKSDFDQAFVGTSLFLQDSLIKEGTGVLIIGYPLNIGVEALGNQPVSRIGIVAQSVTTSGTFLIDGLMSHGNSGSPVFDAETLNFLGIVSEFKGDQIDFRGNAGNLLARLPQNSGITLCVSARTILKLIP